MSSNNPNEAATTDPVCLACQAEYVLAAIDEERPAHQALLVFLKASNERLSDALDTVEAPGTPPTWEGLVDPLERASLDLFHALALFEAVLADEDDPAMEAVGTLLRMAKHNIDELTNAMIAKVRPEDAAPPHRPEIVPSAESDTVPVRATRSRKAVPA